MDDAGKLLVEIKNYTVKKSMMNVNEDKSYKGQTDTVICSVKWEKRPTERLKMVLPGDVLVFDVKGNIKNTLLEKTSGLIASVTPGTDFKEIGELEYEI